jgi:hypothetical protein
MSDKKLDLTGPGISTYEKVDEILPKDYESLLYWAGNGHSKRFTKHNIFVLK